MPPKNNPLNLNALQLKTLTLLQELARLGGRPAPDSPEGHVLVEQPDRRVERLAASQFQALRAVDGEADVVPLARQQRLEDLPHHLLVVDDENLSPGSRHCRLSCRASARAGARRFRAR